MFSKKQSFGPDAQSQNFETEELAHEKDVYYKSVADSPEKDVEATTVEEKYVDRSSLSLVEQLMAEINLKGKTKEDSKGDEKEKTKKVELVDF